EHGLRVPEDVALVCFNATQESAYNVPSLTAVRQPVDKMARAAIDMLKNWDGEVRRVEFEFYLRTGESCGCQGHEIQPEKK
ncbi:substrate-binding domain-containing protein, partial [Escherichia coli]